MKIKLNPDQEVVQAIREGLKRTGGYCPCRIERTEATKCMCQEFKEQIADPGFEGFCHCMLYYKSFMIEDLERGKVRQFHWNDVEGLPCDGSVTLLDVRTEGEYQRGHLNGFLNIPLDNLRERLDELDQNKSVYVNCQTGLHSYLAC